MSLGARIRSHIMLCPVSQQPIQGRSLRGGAPPPPHFRIFRIKKNSVFCIVEEIVNVSCQKHLYQSQVRTEMCYGYIFFKKTKKKNENRK